MQTTLELLGAQHQEVLTRLNEVEAALHAGDASYDAFADFLVGDVLQHFTVEEEALFPFLARHLGTEGGPLAVMNAEHASFRERLRKLRAAVAAGDANAQRACTIELVALLRAHIRKEDGVLFPMASRLLSTNELRQMDDKTAELGRAAAGRAS